MSIDIQNALTSLLGGNSSLATLFGSKVNEHSVGLSADVLGAQYISQSGDVVDLSKGLADYIEKNVKDEAQKAHLLASLKSIQDLGALSSPQNATNAVSTLLGGKNNASGVLNLIM